MCLREVYFNRRADRCVYSTPRYVSLFSIVRLIVSLSEVSEKNGSRKRISRPQRVMRLCLGPLCERFSESWTSENPSVRYQSRIAAAQRVDYVHAITGSFRTPPEPERVQALVAKASLLQTRLS